MADRDLISPSLFYAFISTSNSIVLPKLFFFRTLLMLIAYVIARNENVEHVKLTKYEIEFAGSSNYEIADIISHR